MTEQEWLRCNDPEKMVECVCREPGGWLHRLITRWGRRPTETSPRKLRLFACACCRRLSRFYGEAWFQKAIDVSERYADGLVSEEELKAMQTALPECPGIWRTGDVPVPIRLAAGYLVASDHSTVMAAVPNAATAAACDQEAMDRVIAKTRPAHAVSQEESWGLAHAVVAELRDREATVQCALLRDITGNPFRQRTTDSSWLTGNGGALRELAQSVYDERRWPEGTLDTARLAALAAALEDIGCTDPDILSHCRGPGPHVRGCWVVDLLLGKD